MNERDSEIMSQALQRGGYEYSDSIDSADVIILNTCSIRAKAEHKVVSLLGALRKNKIANPQLQICVAGCVAQQEGESLIRKMPFINLVIGTQHIYTRLEVLETTKTQSAIVANSLVDDYTIPRFLPKVESHKDVKDICRFVTIMQGCNNFCTYCVVPYTRGREISRKKGDILDEVKVLVDSGVYEITLLGQNVNSYGIANSVTDDGSPYDFANLLQDVSQTNGLKRLRFTTSNPKDLSPSLIRCFQEIPILCPQLHLPVQSGSNAVLARMNRKYTREHYRELVLKLREAQPAIALSTDIIVGFPGETDADFQDTLDLLNEIQFHSSFSFKYSDRPKTASANFKDKVPEKIKTERLAIFQKRQDEISLARNREYTGKIMEILVEAATESSFSGRTNTNHLVHVHTAHGAAIGDFVDVRIIHAGQHALIGEPTDAQ